MIKNILAVSVLVALSACSGGSSDNDDSPNDGDQNNGAVGNDPDNGAVGNDPDNTIESPGGGAGPMTATAAGSYTGTIGSSTGVFVINNNFELSGLAINSDGSALSVFGDVGTAATFTGALRQYIHQESRIDPVLNSFGAIAGRANDLSIDVNIVNGQSIESTAESATAVMLLGTTGSSVSPANVGSLAGTWSGDHIFCGDTLDDCQTLTTSLTFNGTDVTGSTVVINTEGVASGPTIIAGSITEFGDVALFDFTWGDAPVYSGVAFFNPGQPDRLVFVGENADNTANPTISAVMTAQ